MTFISPLQSVQAKFCIMKIGSQIRLAEVGAINALKSCSSVKDLQMFSKQDGNLLISRALELMMFSGNVKEVANDFWVNPSTHIYDEIAFSPLATPANVLNFWQDPVIEPALADWTPIKNYLLEVICNGKAELYDYLIRYLAHMVQKPGQKPGVMLVMLGAQGTGKGTFFRLLREIWARTCLQVNDVDDVIGRFNASLEHNFVICMDEALFAGDKKSIEKLKSLITEEVIRTEQKMQPKRTIASYHRFFAASNNDHFAHVDADDRRFVFFRVSSSRQGDRGYWAKLSQSLKDPVQLSGMMQELSSIDLSDFDVTRRPNTEENLAQKIRSLNGFERYWYELIYTGLFPTISNGGGNVWDGPIFIATSTLQEGFKNYDRQAERYRPIQADKIRSSIKRICPSAAQGRCNTLKIRGYYLPSLTKARSEFEQYIGGKPDWDACDVGDASCASKTSVEPE